MAGGEKQKQLAALAPSSGASRHLLPLRRRRVGVLGFPGRRHNRDSRLNPAPTRTSPATVSFRTSRTPTPNPSPDRTSVVSGKSVSGRVDLGGARTLKKK